MQDIILYGKRKGEKYEEIVAKCTSVEVAEQLKPIAEKRYGFVEFRIAVYDMSLKPDFIGAIN